MHYLEDSRVAVILVVIETWAHELLILTNVRSGATAGLISVYIIIY